MSAERAGRGLAHPLGEYIDRTVGTPPLELDPGHHTLATTAQDAKLLLHLDDGGRDVCRLVETTEVRERPCELAECDATHPPWVSKMVDPERADIVRRRVARELIDRCREHCE